MTSVNFLDSYYSNFHLMPHQAECCSHYKLLHWSVSYFLSQWDANVGQVTAGTIVRYGKLFHVNFCSHTSLQKLKDIAAVNPNAQVALSFRKSGNLPAIVIVSADRRI